MKFGEVLQRPFLFLLFSLSLHLDSGFSNMVYRPAGPIMGYLGFYVLANTDLMSTLVQAKLLRSKFWVKVILEGDTRALEWVT